MKTDIRETTSIPRTIQSEISSSQLSSSCNIKSILLPIDFSAASVRVLDYAVPFAEEFGAKLTLLHVVESITAIDFAQSFAFVSDPSKLIAVCKGQLELLMKKNAVDPKLVEKVIVLEGRAFHVITNLARELGIDLIMTATHGYTGLDHILIGSTAEGIVRHAPCPVLVIRPRLDRPLDTGFRLSKILVPIDFSPCSKKALSYAAVLAHEHHAELTLLHVVEPVPDYGVGDSGLFHYGISEPDYPRLNAEKLSFGAEQLSEFVRHEVPPEISVTTLVRTGSPAHEIHETAKKISADLIAISTHGRTGLKHVFLGSVTEKVVRRAPCPVLVVREREHEFIH